MYRFLTCPCLLLNDSNSEETIFRSVLEPVILNVYDLYKFNEFATNVGLGVFHSGVELYGREYGYGGHPYDFSGIFAITPRCVDELSEFFNVEPNRIRFKESITIGYTYYTRSNVKRLLRKKLEKKFQGNKYHLLSNNCNHFSTYFTKILCKKEIPGWVNRLATVTNCLPFVEKCLPAEWIAPFCRKMCNKN